MDVDVWKSRMECLLLKIKKDTKRSMLGKVRRSLHCLLVDLDFKK